MKSFASLLLAFSTIFTCYKPSLPQLYYFVCKKRGIPVKKFRCVEKSGLKVTKLKLDVQYFETCLEVGLCPPKFKVKDQKVNEPTLNAQVHRVVLKNALTKARHELNEAQCSHSELIKDLNSCLSLMERVSLNSLLCARYKKEENVILERHNKKLFNLWSYQSKLSPDCITNVSSRELTVQEYNALQFGLQHHILPKSYDSEMVKVNIEEAVDSAVWKTKGKVDFDMREDVKRCYFQFEKDSEKVCSSKKNIFLHRTLRRLANDNSICICSYDKGTGVVIMDRSDYYRKLDNIVADSTKFVEIAVDEDEPKSHPIVVKQNSIKYYIKKYVPQEQQRELTPSGSQPGKLYGLCKVHKKDFPMRPIVSMVNTPEYKLAKYLDNFIKPNIPKKFMLNSTQDFLSKINSFPLKGGEHMVSYDVVSLFTNVPLLETIDIVIKCVYGRKSITTPPFDKDIFRKMLLLCSQSYFMYNDTLYQQVNGVSMGGPLAPSLANIFLAYLENELLDNAESNCSFFPKLFLRYVDDCFALFDCSDHAYLFLDLLNNLHPSITFTVERNNDCMPFLDVNVRIESNSFVTSVYRKTTHTGVLLSFLAVAPLVWKKGMILCLLNRAKMICSSTVMFQSEVANLKEMFIANAYPIKFINNVINIFYRKCESTELDNMPNCDEEQLPYILLRVPYYGKCSVRFAHKLTNIICKKFDVNVRVVYSTFKLKSYFRLKSLSPLYLSSNVIYHYKCMNDSCSDSYVGYTTRHLYERCNEHLDLQTKKQSEIKDHIRQCNACQCLCPDYTDFKILRRCRDATQCKFFEAFAIKRLQPVLNKQLFANGASKILHVWK